MGPVKVVVFKKAYYKGRCDIHKYMYTTPALGIRLCIAGAFTNNKYNEQPDSELNRSVMVVGFQNICLINVQSF